MSSCACVHDAPGTKLSIFKKNHRAGILVYRFFVEDSRLIDIIGKNRNDGIPATRGREEPR